MGITHQINSFTNIVAIQSENNFYSLACKSNLLWEHCHVFGPGDETYDARREALKVRICTLAKSWFQVHDRELLDGIQLQSIRSSSPIYGTIVDIENALIEMRSINAAQHRNSEIREDQNAILRRSYPEGMQILEVCQRVRSQIESYFPDQYILRSDPLHLFDYFSPNAFCKPCLISRIWRAISEAFHSLCLYFSSQSAAACIAKLMDAEIALRCYEEDHTVPEEIREVTRRWAAFLKTVGDTAKEFSPRRFGNREIMRLFPEDPILDYQFHIHPQNTKSPLDRRTLSSKFYNYLHLKPEEADASGEALTRYRRSLNVSFRQLQKTLKELRREIAYSYYGFGFCSLLFGHEMRDLKAKIDHFQEAYFKLIHQDVALRSLYPSMSRSRGPYQD